MSGDERVEYTPTTDEVRERWRDEMFPNASDAAFNRWLAAHDAEVLHGAADALDAESQAVEGMYAGDCTERLRAMAYGRAEVIAQRPGVDVEAVANLAHRILTKYADECERQGVDRTRTSAVRVAANVVRMELSEQIAALAPARPSVSAEQVPDDPSRNGHGSCCSQACHDAGGCSSHEEVRDAD